MPTLELDPALRAMTHHRRMPLPVIRERPHTVARPAPRFDPTPLGRIARELIERKPCPTSRTGVLGLVEVLRFPHRRITPTPDDPRRISRSRGNSCLQGSWRRLS